jgi:hypothetical protein
VSRRKRKKQLAYRRFARHLAEQRRLGIAEDEAPENILLDYHPEPERLFGDARWTAFLYYSSGHEGYAKAALMRAVDLFPQIPEVQPWPEWILSKAQELARLRENQQEGEFFILWAFDALLNHHPGALIRKTLARYYADQAFQSHQRKSRNQVLTNAFLAIKNDWVWIKNRRLLAISWNSIRP